MGTNGGGGGGDARGWTLNATSTTSHKYKSDAGTRAGTRALARECKCRVLSCQLPGAERYVPSASARCKCQMPIAKGQELSGECQVPSARASRRMLNADDAKAAPRDAAAEK